MKKGNFFTALFAGIVGGILITIGGIVLGPAGALVAGGAFLAAVAAGAAIGGLVGVFIAA